MNPFITIKELKKKLKSKEISITEVVNFYKERIKKHDKKLNSVIESFNDVEDTSLEYDDSKYLSGIPFLVKDNIAQKGRALTAASNVLKGYKAPYNATVIDRLFGHGAMSLGRTNMDEFAMGGSGEYSVYGLTRNPWNLDRSPGGSSSGSAAAVAAGLAPFSLGSETGNSIRQPASFCNLVGLYTTYGIHSRYGVIAFASSTDQVGVFTRTVFDQALVLSSLSGKCIKDPISICMESQDYTEGLDGIFPKNFKVGILNEECVNKKNLHADVLAVYEDTIKLLEKNNITIKEMNLPHLKYGVSVYFIISRAEAASNLARFDGSLYGNRTKHDGNLQEMYTNTRHDGFGIEVQRRLLTGNYVLSSAHQGEYYEQANHVRSMIRGEFLDAFKDVDVILTPTVSTLPFPIGEVDKDPFTLYLADYFAVPTCVIGTPGISFPAGFSKNGLPVGMQFLGPRRSEKLLLKSAHAFESLTEYYKKVSKDYV
jgi:aspartyl-tRNA(Asn)/glutamyl-tRNA(Gln) amidotransferase subunit A